MPSTKEVFSQAKGTANTKAWRQYDLGKVKGEIKAEEAD